MLGPLPLIQGESQRCSLVPRLEGLGDSHHPRFWGCLLPPEALRPSPASFSAPSLSLLCSFSQNLLFLFLCLLLSSSLWVSLLSVSLGLDFNLCPQISQPLCLLLCLLLSFSHSFSLSLSLLLFPHISFLLSLFASPSTPISLLFFSFSPGSCGKQGETMEPGSPAQHFFSSPCISLSPVHLPSCPVLPA